MMSPAGISAPAGGIKGCQFGDGSDSAHLGSPFACNNKLVGAYAKMATYMANTGADGAGVLQQHLARVLASRLRGPRHAHHRRRPAATVSRRPCCTASSGARSAASRPGAHVEMYRVCARAGCFGSDSVSAVQQAITDGVNVINFSISGGALAVHGSGRARVPGCLTNAGISVNASAGNSGPGAATSDHGGPWTTTVGASTGPRSFTSTLHLTADGGATLDISGVTLTNGISQRDSGRDGGDAAEGRWRQRGRPLPVGPRSWSGDGQDRGLPARRPTAASTRAAGSSQAVRPG